MNDLKQLDYQEISQIHELEDHPLSDIAIASLNKIIQDSTISREKKLRLIVEFNLSFSIVYYCILTSRNTGKLHEIDYAFMVLQLANWYKVNHMVA
ncbi:MAG: hypothetical protein ACW99A_13125 [Candidatus Kariarchaeaceae archaeon]|jgi:hypothetical protein